MIPRIHMYRQYNHGYSYTRTYVYMYIQSIQMNTHTHIVLQPRAERVIFSRAQYNAYAPGELFFCRKSATRGPRGFLLPFLLSSLFFYAFFSFFHVFSLFFHRTSSPLSFFSVLIVCSRRTLAAATAVARICSKNTAQLPLRNEKKNRRNDYFHSNINRKQAR